MCTPVQNPHCHGHRHGQGSCTCSCMQMLSIEDEIKSLEDAKQRMQVRLEMTERKIEELKKIR